jgi:tetratricopeptide (TPR) repeat protein
MTTLIRLILSTALLLATCSAVPAQTREGVDILLSKARSLEARGRTDLAAQNWNQVLLVNPNQTEALEGLARHAKQNGDAEALRRYLERLRKIDPDNPAIEAIEKARVLTPQDLKLLDDAGGLAAQQKPGDAMAIYRRVFGDTPPPGKWAEAFYEAEASAGGRDLAIAQLRERSSRDPANEVYRLWLARLLTYDPATRQEGLGLLESIRDPGAVDQARAAWRQALMPLGFDVAWFTEEDARPRAMQLPLFGDMNFRSDGMSEDCLYLNIYTAAKSAMLFFVKGEATVGLGDDMQEAQAGTWVHMPAGLKHSIKAKTPVVMLLVLMK